MLFRNTDGNLHEIKKIDFNSDKLYYEQVLQTKTDIKSPKNNNIKNDILNLIK